jgi:predicted O-linked N-acetylglucosamine transferase (SPINDLY family)
VLAPERALHYGNLGAAEWESGDRAAALASARRTLRIAPKFVYAWLLLAQCHREAGRPAEAIAAFRALLELDEAHLQARFELAELLLSLNDPDAVLELERVLSRDPSHGGALNRLSFAYRLSGHYTRSRSLLVRLLGHNPLSPRTAANLGLVQREAGLIDDARRSYERAVALAPANPAIRSELLLTLHYDPGVGLADLRAAAEAWERAVPAVRRSGVETGGGGGRQPGTALGRRPLRVGFVSGDLRRHPVGYFARRLFDALDPARVAILCFSTAAEADDRTELLKRNATAWHDVVQHDEEALERLVRREEVDVLIDLSGHTGRNRLPLFQKRPAPLAMTWAGWCGTTGAGGIDYLIADGRQVPPHLEWGYSERIARLPDGYIVYDPPDYAPPVVPLPALARGAVTFGCFNNLAKLNGRVIALWAEILRRLPRSRLLLHTRALGDLQAAERVAWQFGLEGIGAAQLELRGEASHPDLLAAYGEVDLALDPFPYSGGLTTCEALWMGVPVLTLPDERFAGRHSLSHLTTVGLTGWIAADPADYVAKALAFAGDLPALAVLRAGLRETVAASPLTDGPRFARNFEALLLTCWNSEISRP